MAGGSTASAGGSRREPVRHEISTADGPLPALLWLPEGASADAPVPGLVLVQEIFGLSDYIRSRGADLADQGYAVLAPQVFARLAPPVEAVEDDDPDVLGTAMGLVGQVDWELAVRDVLGARDALVAMPEVEDLSVGLVGFCFGGGLAFDVAARAAQAGAPVAALVSFYGSALPGLLAQAEHVTCPSLHVFGTADSYIPSEQVEQIREAVTAGGTREQVRLELHEGAGHAFDNPNPMFHHEEASRAAWAQAEEFLAEHLPTGR
ncbi:dienelactone hydrolase family protein [Ornithinimicrobium sp. W1665]|uniref:dienelactone hydrolase family protein n=1 Tax=Ornithinimicrobium sp. W1665 TaxID=3416666 RepID=UPI003CF5CDA7